MKPLDYKIVHVNEGAGFGTPVEVKGAIPLFFSDKTVFLVAEKKINKIKWTFSIKCEKAELRQLTGAVIIVDKYTLTIVSEKGGREFKDSSSNLPYVLDIAKERCKRICKLGHL